MQFQTDMLGCPVEVPNAAELSAIGVAYAAGIAIGIYDAATIFDQMERKSFRPDMPEARRDELLKGWQAAVRQTIHAVYDGCERISPY